MYQSTITSWALMLSKVIEHDGHNSEHIFEMAGLDIDKLRAPNARYSYQGMTKLWSLAASETGDECIRDLRHSINEVAYLLGFTEPSNFSRAFKRWVGVSPGKFLEGLQA